MNLQKMMKQAQEMQAKMQQMQGRLAEQESEGSSGGGMVKVTLTGKGEMRRLHIDPSLIDPNDPEVLEDLILAAHNDAKAKADAAAESAMGDLTGGLNLPPGFKLPF